MLLIKEHSNDVSILKEDAANGDKNLYIQGVFLQSGIKNGNGRIYPEAVMDKAVGVYIDKYVNANRAMGELSHPASNPNITLERVSHLIVSLDKDGKNWIGKAKIMENTQMGAIAKGLINGGVQLGVSSRALGSVKEENGTMVVQDDLVICTAADIVADPSAPDAFVQSMMEGSSWIMVDGKYCERDISESMKRINKTPSRLLKEQFLKEFQYFMQKISR